MRKNSLLSNLHDADLFQNPSMSLFKSCVHKPGDVYEFDHNDKYAPKTVNDTVATTMGSCD
jgi:hypothetical protein